MQQNMVRLNLDKKLKSVDFVLSFFAKLIPVAIAYGGWQLLGLSRYYQIPYLELAKSEVMLTYGVLSIFLIVSLGLFPFFIVYLGHMSGRSFYRVWIMNSRVPVVIKYKRKSFLIIAAILSVWPMVLLSYEYYSLLLVYPIALFMLMCVFTRVAFSFHGGVRKNGIFSILFLTAIISCSMIFGVFLFYLLSKLLQGIFDGFPVYCFYIFLCFVYYVLYFMSIIPVTLSKKRRDVIVLYMVLVGTGLFYVSLSQPKILIDKVANVAGFGNAETCYLAKNLRENDVPEYFLGPTSRQEIVKVNVIAKINDVYYFSAVSDGNNQTRIRVVSDSFKAISCPVEPAGISTTK